MLKADCLEEGLFLDQWQLKPLKKLELRGLEVQPQKNWEKGRKQECDQVTMNKNIVCLETNKKKQRAYVGNI